MKRIAIIGGFGYSDVGDESQLTADLINLRAHLPKAHLLVLSDNPENTRQYHKVETDYSINHYLRLRTPAYSNSVTKKVFKGLNYLRLTQFLKGLLFLYNARRLKSDKKTVLLDAEETRFLAKLKETNLLFNSGGGNLNSIFHMELYSKCFTYIICRTFGTPIVLSGQSIGPFDNWFDRFIASFSLERVNVITLREHFSMKELASIGVKRPLILVAADDATLLPREDDTKISDVFCFEKIPRHHPLIAVNMNEHSARRVSATKLKKTLRLLAEICDYLIESHNARIVFVPMSYHATADDRLAASRILDLMKHKEKAFLITGEHDDRMIKSIIGSMDMAIGLRYHFIVFAANSQVPSIGIYLDDYYAIKMKGILDLVGQKEFALGIDELSFQGLVELIENILSNKETIRASLAQHTKELERKSLVSIEYAKKLLSPR